MVEQEPENPLPYFYEGLTLNRLGRFEEAPARFDRSWLLDQDLKTSARFHSGVAYLRMDLRDEATEAFNEVIATEPKSQLAQSSRTFLHDMTKPKEKKVAGKRRSWNLTLLVSPQYDDNVILQAPGGQLPEGISRQDDYKTTMFGRGEIRFKETDKMALGGSYSFYQSFHTTLDEFDVQGHSPTLFATYQASGIQGRLQYQFDHFSVGREAYMAGHSISPMLMIARSSTLTTQLQYRFQAKNFNDDMVSFANNSDRDGTNHLAGITQFFLFSERRGNVRAGYVFDNERVRNPTWDYRGHRFSLGVSSPPILTMRFDAAFDYYLQNYLSPNDFSPTLAERRDDIMNATVTMTKPIGASLSIGLQYLYNRNQSNIQLFDFNRSVWAIMGTARF